MSHLTFYIWNSTKDGWLLWSGASAMKRDMRFSWFHGFSGFHLKYNSSRKRQSIYLWSLIENLNTKCDSKDSFINEALWLLQVYECLQLFGECSTEFPMVHWCKKISQSNVKNTSEQLLLLGGGGICWSIWLQRFAEVTSVVSVHVHVLTNADWSWRGNVLYFMKT